MWSELASGAVGIVLGYAGSFLEPLKSQIQKAGRASFGDAGVDVNVESDPEVIWAGFPNWIGFNFYFAGGLPEGAPPSSGRAWRNWAYANGGMDCVESLVRLTVVSRSRVTVVLEVPIVSVTEERAPAGKRLVYAVGGAAIAPTCFEVDLDTFGVDNPIVTLAGEQGEPMQGPLSWSLSQGEANTILLRVRSNAPNLVHWRARLPLIVDGRRRFVEVDEDGEDFVFAGSGIEGEDHFWMDDNGIGGCWKGRTEL